LRGLANRLDLSARGFGLLRVLAKLLAQPAKLLVQCRAV